MVRRQRGRQSRRGAALVTAVVLLLVMATITATVLSMRLTDMQAELDAVRALRARAAADGALQLAAWKIASEQDWQASAAATVDHRGDTWKTKDDPLFVIDGALSGTTFRVDVWPRPGEFRMRAEGVSDGAHSARWTYLPISRAGAE